MLPVSVLYGSVLIALGCWAAFTTSKTLASRGGWARHRVLVVVGVAFVASCLLPGIAMLSGAFRPWTLIPLGLGYLALIPLPCYWDWANHGWAHTGRTILFLSVAVALLAAGLGWLPVSWFGL